MSGTLGRSSRRLRGPRRRRLALGAALLGVIALAQSASVAGADPSETVTAIIHRAGSATPVNETVTLGILTETCPLYDGPNIELYLPDGDQAPEDSINDRAAWTLSSVLGCLMPPVPLAAVTGITVIGADGPELSGPPDSSRLTPADLATPSDFADPSQSPLIYSDGEDIIYLRPWRGPGDVNAADQVNDAEPTPFVFDVYEGPLLTVTASASRRSLPAGGTVSFAATVSGAPAGTPLSYSWDFDGGAADSSSPSPTVVFDSPGDYAVSLAVGDDEGGGGGATIQVVVGSPAQTTTTTGQRTGPSDSHGKRAGAPRGRRSGSNPDGSRRDHAGSSRRQSGSAAGHPPAAVSATTSTAGPTSSSTDSETSAGPTRQAGPVGRGRPAQVGAPPSGSPALVAGRLISDITPLPAGISPLVHPSQAAPAAAPAFRRSFGASAGAGLSAVLAGLILFGLGATRELRGRRSRRVGKLLV